MSISYHERPGVYAVYDASSITAQAGSARVIALVAQSSQAAGVYTLYTAAQALEQFGQSEAAGTLLQLMYQNGAQKVLVSPVAAADKAGYQAALSRLDGQAAQLMVTDSAEEEIQLLLQQEVLARAERGEACIGLVGMEEPGAAELIARAAQLNCERMVLLGPDVVATGQSDYGGGCLAAAALAGVLAAQTDPALPLNGAVLAGLSGVSASWSETELDSLLRGGVTPVELVGGQVQVIRGQTTRTTTAGVADATYRELTTVLIIDEVIPAIRTALAAKFARRKNNAVTRNAIRSQVAIELEERVNREIIEEYSNLTVTADAADPTTCVVEFSFTVVHGLCRIFLTAHIQV